jgi:uncharacterized protein (TIGR03435 family)
VWPVAGTPLYRVIEGNVRAADPPSLLRRFGVTGTIRSNGGAGAVIALADGSRIEMRSRTDLSLDRADDGLRIRLKAGGIIVNAAQQHAGHLYVQTKDMTVSVVGTVFVVNADAEGSRVAVIEGEVRVQQGATETKLRSGDRVATSSNAEASSVASELAWSRRAADLIALMQRQSEAAQQPTTAAAPKDVKAAFEAISIRPSPLSAPGGRGGGGGDERNLGPKNGCMSGPRGYSIRLDPRRLAVTRTTLLHLVASTIPVRTLQGLGQQRRPDMNPRVTGGATACELLTNAGLLSGGPDWIRTDLWDVIATIPEGVISSAPALTDPVLEQMLKTMLAERFGLAMHHETREIPVYLLKVGKDGPRFNGPSPMLSNLMTWDRRPALLSEQPPPPDGDIDQFRDNLDNVHYVARNVTMADWANYLYGPGGRPVLDRTNLAGRYDFHHTVDVAAIRGIERRIRDLVSRGVPEQEVQLASDAIAQDQRREVVRAMGFELEEGRATFEVWVIDRVERPSEN